jgi:hypothetical protein
VFRKLSFMEQNRLRQVEIDGFSQCWRNIVRKYPLLKKARFVE